MTRAFSRSTDLEMGHELSKPTSIPVQRFQRKMMVLKVITSHLGNRAGQISSFESNACSRTLNPWVIPAKGLVYLLCGLETGTFHTWSIPLLQSPEDVNSCYSNYWRSTTTATMQFSRNIYIDLSKASTLMNAHKITAISSHYLQDFFCRIIYENASPQVAATCYGQDSSVW